MEIPNYVCLLASVIAMASPDSARSEKRTFELKSGASFEGELIDVRSGQVTMIANGAQSSIAMSNYSAADRTYFREWVRQNRGIFNWPGERGYRSDGTTDENLPPGAPEIVWRAKVGDGDAAVLIDGKNAVTSGVRDGRFTLVSLRVGDGSVRWSKSYRVTADGKMPVASPTIAGEDRLVYSLGPSGRIDGWQLTDGANVWSTLFSVNYQDAVLSAGKTFASPLLGPTGLYLEVGGPAYSLVSLAKSNGAELWRIGRHRSLGATPVLAEIGKQQVVISRNQYGIVGRNAESGTMQWDQAWQGGGRASPVAIGKDQVFVTSEKACAMFRITGRRTQQVWANSALCSRVSTPVHHDGYLYGFNGDALTCIKVESGEIAWSEPGVGAGNLIRAADKLLIQTGSSGELVVVDVDPQKFVERSRTKVFDGASRTVPVFVNGQIYCRSAAGDISCLKLVAKE